MSTPTCVAEHRELLHRRGPPGVERRHQDPLALALLEPLARASPSWWSCPSPAARPSGSARAGCRCAGPRPCRRPRAPRTSSSWTILTTCWPGVTDFVTAWPRAFSVTALTKSRATGSETSASSSATRTSRSATPMSSSLSAPALVSLPKTPDKPVGQVLEHAFSSRMPKRGVRRWAQRADRRRSWVQDRRVRDLPELTRGLGEMPAGVKPRPAWGQEGVRCCPCPARRRCGRPGGSPARRWSGSGSRPPRW